MFYLTTQNFQYHLISFTKQAQTINAINKDSNIKVAIKLLTIPTFDNNMKTTERHI